METLTATEIDQVSGGLTMAEGGVAILGFPVTAATVGAFFATGFGLVVGGGLLLQAYAE